MIVTGEGLADPRVFKFGQCWANREQLIKTTSVMPDGTIHQLEAGANLWDIQVLFVDEEENHWHLQTDDRVVAISEKRWDEILEHHE